MVETRRSSSASRRFSASSQETSSSSRPSKRAKAAAEPAASSSTSEIPVENQRPTSDPGSESGEPRLRTSDPQANVSERPVTTTDVPVIETDTYPEVEGVATPIPAVTGISSVLKSKSPSLVSLCLGVIGRNLEEVIPCLADISAVFPSDIKMSIAAG